mmetsp:Transcript_30107/g.75803  ORF Transcript_30107/g.75803 Transcript_30107/m.75803 type:complete len:292 (-) Transcript_30107:256-1131(-)
MLLLQTLGEQSVGFLLGDQLEAMLGRGTLWDVLDPRGAQLDGALVVQCVTNAISIDKNIREEQKATLADHMSSDLGEGALAHKASPRLGEQWRFASLELALQPEQLLHLLSDAHTFVTGVGRLRGELPRVTQLIELCLVVRGRTLLEVLEEEQVAWQPLYGHDEQRGQIETTRTYVVLQKVQPVGKDRRMLAALGHQIRRGHVLLTVDGVEREPVRRTTEEIGHTAVGSLVCPLRGRTLFHLGQQLFVMLQKIHAIGKESANYCRLLSRNADCVSVLIGIGLVRDVPGLIL